MKKFRRAQSGYTLIELIVVIGIIALLFLISIPNFNQYERNARVRNSAKDIRSLMWEAQGFALAPQNPDINSYSIAIRTGIDDQVNIQIRDNFDELVKEISPRKDVSIERIFDNNNNSVSGIINILFLTGNKIGGNIDFESPNDDINILNIRLGSTISNVKYDIIVNKATNSIEMQVVNQD